MTFKLFKKFMKSSMREGRQWYKGQEAASMWMSAKRKSVL